MAIALSALHLETLVNTLSADALDRSDRATQEVSSFLIDHINQHSSEYPVFSTLVSTKELWYHIVSSDRDVASMLQKTMALGPSIVEINVAGEDRAILASSSERRVGAQLTQLRDFSQWSKGSAMSRLLDLMKGGLDYEVLARLGIQGQSESILTIQVVTSTVLLRDPLLPQIKGLAAVSGGSLLVVLGITLAATNLALRPLKRIDQTIDRIVQGKYGGEAIKPRPRPENSRCWRVS